MSDEFVFGFGCIPLVAGRVPFDLHAGQAVLEEVNHLMQEHGMLETARFKGVSLIIYYGDEREEPTLGKVRRGYLPVDMTLPMVQLKAASARSPGDLKSMFLLACADVLDDIAVRYALPRTCAEKIRARVDSANALASDQG